MHSSIDLHEHIEARTKGDSCWRWHLYKCCLYTKHRIYIRNTMKCLHKSSSDNKPALDNGLAPNKRQAIIWTNDSQVYWYIWHSASVSWRSRYCYGFAVNSWKWHSHAIWYHDLCEHAVDHNCREVFLSYYHMYIFECVCAFIVLGVLRWRWRERLDKHFTVTALSLYLPAKANLLSNQIKFAVFPDKCTLSIVCDVLFGAYHRALWILVHLYE